MANTKKAVQNILMILFLLGFLAVALYVQRYHDNVYEYPIVVLENIIRDNIASPETYDRVKDRKKEKPARITVELKYSHTAPSGKKTAENAVISYIPRWDFEEKRLPCLSGEEKQAMAEIRKKNTSFPVESMLVESLVVGGREFTMEEIETLNTDLMSVKDAYPYAPPSPKTGGANYFSGKCPGRE